MASRPFSQVVLPIQQALAHFTEKPQAGKGSSSPEATELKRVDNQDLTLGLCWVPGRSF